MSKDSEEGESNSLLGGLSSADRDLVLRESSRMTLEEGAILALAGESTEQIYFPLRGYIGLTTPRDDGKQRADEWGLGIGLIGNEGMLGAFPSLGVELSFLNATVMEQCSVFRVQRANFRRLLIDNRRLLKVITDYCRVQLGQLIHAISCNRFHPVEQRLARHLLMIDDRSHTSPIRITQEDLAKVLGVQRPAVNVAASALQGRGRIHYRRGKIEILDRAGLVVAACGCYRPDSHP